MIPRAILFWVMVLCAQSGLSQSKYEGDGLYSLQGVTEGSEAFQEILDSLGPFELEIVSGNMMKIYRNKNNGVSFTMNKRKRVNSPGEAFILSEMTLSLGLTNGYYTGELPLDIFTIITQKEQLQIMKSKSDVEIMKNRSGKGYIALKYTGYKNARLSGPLSISLSYIDDRLYQLVIGH